MPSRVFLKEDSLRILFHRSRSFLPRFLPRLLAATLFLLPATAGAQTCARNLTADVVALDQVFFWNRLGSVQPQGRMYALRRDVVALDGTSNLTPGNVQLRPGKRPRPIVEPAGSVWYRSQVTEADLRNATTSTTASGYPTTTPSTRRGTAWPDSRC